MDPRRVHQLNTAPVDRRGGYVLYWMQHAQRACFNHALEYAVRRANALGQGIVVGFGLDEGYPGANARHFAFMLDGLAETAARLRARGIRFVLRQGAPDAVALALAAGASAIVCDRGYLRHERRWRRRVATEAGKRVTEVETDAVVPVAAASGKLEFSARTLRPKLQRLWPELLGGLTETAVKTPSLSLAFEGALDPSDPARLLESLEIDASVPPAEGLRGGTGAAREHLTRFLRRAFPGYADGRGDPVADRGSRLSPYLHFGHISPLEVVRKARSAKGGGEDDRTAFLEELLVRRELALNFVTYEPRYDRYSGLPEWARDTLEAHAGDRRPARYSRPALESADTHDAYWNAAMREMRTTGYLHNHLRMYWGKKILEWCNTPRYAHATALYLNNRYFLDGRGASAFANVGWLFGLHDRPWPERAVFGKVRHMSAAGLERKFDIDAYVRRVNRRSTLR